MTDFIVAADPEVEQCAIEQAELVSLSSANQECFAQALIAPPTAHPVLERAFQRRKTLLGGE